MDSPRISGYTGFFVFVLASEVRPEYRSPGALDYLTLDLLANLDKLPAFRPSFTDAIWFRPRLLPMLAWEPHYNISPGRSTTCQSLLLRALRVPHIRRGIQGH